MGIYRHYKGPLYLVLGLAHDANAETLWTLDARGELECRGERTVVVYVPLQLDGAHTGPRMAVRTLEDFIADVRADGSTCEHEPSLNHRLCKPRFEYLGPELTAEMTAAPRTQEEKVAFRKAWDKRVEEGRAAELKADPHISQEVYKP